MKKLNSLIFLFCLTLLFACSETINNKTNKNIKNKNEFINSIYKEISFKTIEPNWVNEKYTMNDGFSDYTFVDTYQNIKIEKEVKQAVLILKEKILKQIENELSDLITQIFEEYSYNTKQSVGNPDDVVKKILKFIPIEKFQIVEFYENKQENKFYVYGVLKYDYIAENLDKIINVIYNDFNKYKLERKTSDYCIQMIKKMLNIYDGEVTENDF